MIGDPFLVFYFFVGICVHSRTDSFSLRFRQRNVAAHPTGATAARFSIDRWSRAGPVHCGSRQVGKHPAGLVIYPDGSNIQKIFKQNSRKIINVIYI